MFILYKLTAWTCWWGSFTDHVGGILDCHWIIFFLTFWGDYLSNIFHCRGWVPCFLFLRTGFLSSYRNLIRFSSVRNFSSVWISNWSFVMSSFFLAMLFMIIVGIGIDLYSCIVISLIFLNEIIIKLLKGIWAFGIQIFGFFHLPHLKVHLLYKTCEFVLISFFISIEFENPLLQNIEETIEAVIVCFLLLSGGKARINWHYFLRFVTNECFIIFFVILSDFICLFSLHPKFNE